ncbi:RabGAP/TBC [Ceraceosorus guamensis]|uniref:RabGAP/TBC n=1 Tax=Ceraceosorus guamensis TaxID=1522189 RepID=A0A316W2H1_9BASI|nr:RabGAP/TBC [Ceraceosorus guamensis]PWN44066.1 RabGAP/TBC [Ceraceosorus guamensis]
MGAIGSSPNAEISTEAPSILGAQTRILPRSVSHNRTESAQSRPASAAGPSSEAAHQPSSSLRPLRLVASSSNISPKLTATATNGRGNIGGSADADAASALRRPAFKRVESASAAILRSRAASPAPSAAESWTQAGDAEGAYIRKTYAHFDSRGVEDDGFVEGQEWTRERGRVSGTEEQDPDYEGESHQEREARIAREEVMSSIDRYGFFAKELNGSSSRPPRTTILPAPAFAKLPSKRRSALKSVKKKPAPKGSPTVGSEKAREALRVEKWQRMLRVDSRDAGGNVSGYRLAPNLVQSKKLRRRVYKGVPDRWRSAAWWALVCDGHHSIFANGDARPHRYAELIKKPSPHDVQIDLDVPRTISGHVLFHTRYGQGQRGLFHVLHAFSLHCDDCAYCQGMGPIAATLLVYLPPERAYACLTAMHDAREYGLHKTFSPGFPGLVESFYVQEQLALAYMPDIARQLLEQDITTSSYATRWYITLFANVVPFQTQIRLWDALLLDGADVLVIFSLAVLWALRDRLIHPNATFETILGALGAELLPEDDDALMRWVEHFSARDDVKKKIAKAHKEWHVRELAGDAHLT